MQKIIIIKLCGVLFTLLHATTAEHTLCANESICLTVIYKWKTWNSKNTNVGYIWVQGWNHWPDNRAAYTSLVSACRKQTGKQLDKPSWKTDYGGLVIATLIIDLAL